MLFRSQFIPNFASFVSYSPFAILCRNRIQMQIYAQPRGRGGGGGGYSHFHQNQPHMPATQPAYYYQQRGPVMNQPQRMQPEKLSKRQVFSHDGRDWTTGICGCFEHCASCTSSLYLSIYLFVFVELLLNLLNTKLFL